MLAVLRDLGVVVIDVELIDIGPDDCAGQIAQPHTETWQIFADHVSSS